MSQPPFLTAAEERDLIARAQAGDVAARNTLIERNIRLIWNEACRFCKRVKSGRGEEYVAVATIAYINAIKRFDLSRELRLITYATSAIRNTLSRDFANNRLLVRVPPPGQKRGAGTFDRQAKARAAMLPVASIHTPIGAEDGATVGDTILGREEDDDENDDLPSFAEVADLAKLMPERWLYVFNERAKGTPFAHIAKALGVTKQRAQEIQCQSFAYLRRLMNSGG